MLIKKKLKLLLMRFQLLNEHEAFNLLHILTKSTFYEGKLIF
jgi:hypothetical protein